MIISDFSSYSDVGLAVVAVQLHDNAISLYMLRYFPRDQIEISFSKPIYF